MGEWFKKIFRGRILSSLFYIGLGLLMILMPGESINLICKYVFGIVMILTGIYHVMILLFEQNNATVLDLFSGVILVVLGFFLFMNPVLVIKVFPILLGGFVLVDSLWTLKGAFTLKSKNRGSWRILAFFGVLFLLAGAGLIIYPFRVVMDMIMFASYTLTACGILDLFFSMLLFFGIRKSDKIARKQAEMKAIELSKESMPDHDESEAVTENDKEADAENSTESDSQPLSGYINEVAVPEKTIEPIVLQLDTEDHIDE